MANPVHNARPNLRKIAPLTFTNVVLFIWLNLGIAYSLYQGRPNASLVIVNGIFNTYFWIGVFLFLSLGHAVSLLRNDWKWLRRFLAFGLFVKFLIAYSLILIGYRIGFSNTIGVTSLWISVAWVQYFTLKYFEKARIIDGSK